jgi:hypothetical protein
LKLSPIFFSPATSLEIKPPCSGIEKFKLGPSDADLAEVGSLGAA